jgi:hypothetical protein
MTGINFEMNWGHAMMLRVLPVNRSRFLFVTLDFHSWDHFEMHHYAFHVSDAEFEAIFGRIKEAGIPFGSGPFSQKDICRSIIGVAVAESISKSPTAMCWNS